MRFFIFFLILSIAGCGENEPLVNNKIKSEEQILIDNNLTNIPINTQLFCDYLQDPLWDKRDAYDAAHMLLIPLEYAFAFDDTKLIKCFTDYVNRLEIQVSGSSWENPGRLNWLQHLHLIARYLVLANDIDGASWVLNEFNRFWLEEPAWLWGSDPFDGIKARIEWKLDTPDSAVRLSYYNVIFDEDYFSLTLGLDLFGLYSRANRLEECAGCVQAKHLFFRVFAERLEWRGQGWLMDVGRWVDHPDFAYSMFFRPPVTKEGKVLESQPRNEIVIDSSHAHRYPSWLRSAQLAVGSDDAYIVKLREGLKFQFLNIILATRQGRTPMLNNYMDGHNGLFRWNYKTHENSITGYGPYALSGTFVLGWWSLLGGEEIAVEYDKLNKFSPLTEAEILLYEGSSTREQHPFISEKWQNGLILKLADMASALARIELYN